MTVKTEYLKYSTRGNAEVVDLTSDVQKKLKKADLSDGIVTISMIGSTGAITTCEYEPGLVQDISDIFDQLIPAPTPRHPAGGRGSDSGQQPDVGAGQYHHDQAWGDGNGHSHLRSSLIGPSITVPFQKKKLILGTWQQIIFIDFDNRARQREIVLQFIGE